MTEPYRIKRWSIPSLYETAHFFTCARPGRSKGTKAKVPDSLIHSWLDGLPAADAALVSLLGKKPNGKSEYSFYSFHQAGRTFQEWLNENRNTQSVALIEYPTVDLHPVPAEVREAVASDIKALLSKGRTVVVFDSGGICRVGQIGKHMRAVVDQRQGGN